ncbi:hypothetical protein Tco_0795362 [Tanacetum coccineum]
MAQTLIKMKEEKDVDDSSRPARSILTLKPLPTIDPKDKGKGVLEESPVKKVKRTDMDAAQIAKDAEITRLIHEKELAKIEKEKKERQRQDQASMDYIASLYDEVQAKIERGIPLIRGNSREVIGVEIALLKSEVNMKQLVKFNEKARILELKQNHEDIVLTSNMPYPARRYDEGMTRSSTKKLFTPFKEPDGVFHSTRKLLKKTSLDYLSSSEFDLFSDHENQSKEEIEANRDNSEVKWDPNNIEFENWLASKFRNHKTMVGYTKNALWDYWRIGNDEETYEEYKDDWINEWNKGIPWVNEKPWTDDGEGGYCNTRDLHGFFRDGNSIHYKDYEWYDMIKDNELKEEALINKRILEESMNVMEESSDSKLDHDLPVDE